MQEAGSSVLELQNRELLKISGVQGVDVFEEEKIVLHTEQGILEIQGQQLNIIQLDLATKLIQIQGTVDAVIYPHERHRRQSKKRQEESFIRKMLS